MVRSDPRIEPVAVQRRRSCLPGSDVSPAVQAITTLIPLLYSDRHSVLAWFTPGSEFGLGRKTTSAALPESGTGFTPVPQWRRTVHNILANGPTTSPSVLRTPEPSMRSLEDRLDSTFHNRERLSYREIARGLGGNRRTVRKHAEHPADYGDRPGSASCGTGRRAQRSHAHRAHSRVQKSPVFGSALR
jgi:hypothetical protein